MQETILIERVVAALEQLGLKVPILRLEKNFGALRADALLRIAKGKEKFDYVVEVKRAVTPATMGAAAAQLRDLADATGHAALLATDYLTPPVAEKLREARQQFADAAGNAYLEWPGLYVFVTGRKPEERLGGRKAGRAFTTNGLKVLFALICDPNLTEAPQRTIAAAAGVALGAVPAVLANLRAAGHLLVAGKHRRLNATKRLLDEWALAYAHNLRAKTLTETYQTQTFDTWRDWTLDPEQERWGGEPAANLLVGYLKPGILTIYTDMLPGRLIIRRRLARAGPLTRDRLVEFRKPFWGKTLRTEGRPDVVPPALVYADLLATGDGRCIETARLIHDRHLARLFPAA